MGKGQTAYQIYLNYKAVLELLDGKELSAEEIQKKTGIPLSTVFKTLNTCLDNKVVMIKSHRMNDNGRRERIFSKVLT